MSFWGRGKKEINSLSVKKLGLVLDSVSEAVVVTSSDGIIIYSNSPIEVFLQEPAADIIGKKFQDLFRFICVKEDPKKFFSETLTGWRSVSLGEECSIIRKDQTPWPVAVVSTPIYNETGEFIGSTIVLRNIKEEADLRRRQYEFLSFVSHQLRLPMGSFRWGLEILLEERNKVSESSQEVLDDLYRIILRMIDFVNNLLEVSKLEAGKLTFKFAEVDLKEVIAGVAAEARGLLVSQNVSLLLYPRGKPTAQLILKSDPQRLHDVLANLVTNAIRYNQPRGTVAIDVQIVDIVILEKLQTSQKDYTPSILNYYQNILSTFGQVINFILIEVSDTGFGIPEHQQKFIFQSFFRGDNVLKKGLQGTGVGLYIVKNIVEALKGKIFFRSAEGQGTSFFVIFPLPGANPVRDTERKNSAVNAKSGGA